MIKSKGLVCRISSAFGMCMTLSCCCLYCFADNELKSLQFLPKELNLCVFNADNKIYKGALVPKSLEFRLIHPKNDQLVAKLLSKEICPPGYKKRGSGYARLDNWSAISQQPDYANKLLRFETPDARYNFMLEDNDDGIFIPKFVARSTEPYVTGADFVGFQVVCDSISGEHSIGFRLSPKGYNKFTTLTRNYKAQGIKNPTDKGRQLAIILNDQLVCSVVIQGEIGIQGQIVGHFDAKRAKNLSDELNVAVFSALWKKSKLADSEIIDFVTKELKSVWDEGDSDFSELTKRAQQEDAEAMYLLARQAVRSKLNNWEDVYRRYMVRAAELGCVKAQLAVAIQWNHNIWARWNSRMGDELKMWRMLHGQAGDYCSVIDYDKQDVSNVVHKIKVYYGNSVSAGYKCVTNLINILDRESPVILAKEKAVKDSEAAKKAMEYELRKAEDEARQKSSRNSESSEPLIPMEEALALAGRGEGKGYYQLAVRYAKGEDVGQNYETALKFLSKAYDANYPCAVFATALANEDRMWSMADDYAFEPKVSELLGVSFSSRKSECITNEVLVAKILDDYKKAEVLGITVAAKEVERLNKRMAIVRAEVAKRVAENEAKKRNDEAARRLIEETSGKTRQFVPFPDSQKLPYQQALEGAKNGDSKSYYWLAYYFAKGDGVDRDGGAAFKFLKKAVNANDPVACYTFGLLLENQALQDENGWSEVDRGTVRGFDGLRFYFGRSDDVTWYSTTRPGGSGSKCLTNEVVVANVEFFYRKAVDGGFPFATNDIARLRQKVAGCLERIQKNEMEQMKKKDVAQKALAILDADDKNKNGQKESEEEAVRKREEEERKLWDSWPNTLPEEASTRIVNHTEEKFACVFMYLFGGTNTWNAGGGKSLIVRDGSIVRKIDADGKTIRVSTTANRDIEELRYFDAEREKFLESERVKWATEHGMTPDDAKAKYAKWKEEHSDGRFSGGLRRPGMLGGGLLGGGSLRARRLQRQQEAAAAAAKQREEQAAKEAERQAQAEQEKQQREAERTEQRQQLLVIQEELKRVRGEKAASEKK